MMAQAIAPTGAMFTFLALLTGAMWGKPTWGAWWVWDARLTSELILLFQYIGIILLRSSIDDLRRADRASAVFGAGRGGQCPDHLFFRAVVEHVAPRGVCQHDGVAKNGGDNGNGDAGHDARVLDVQFRGDTGPHALRDCRA